MAKDKKSHHEPVAQSAAVAAYSDGSPLDAVQYIEAKLILKPDRFTCMQSFRDFGKLVERTASGLGVDFKGNPNTKERPQIHEIVFGDTADHCLHKHSFILRRKIKYQDGFPVGDPEVVFKFRDPDERTAAAMDVRPKIAGAYRIKFKKEALPLEDSVGGVRVFYSHNCQFGLSQMHNPDKLSMATLSHVFPALAALNRTNGEHLTMVSKGAVEEVRLELGQLIFGKGISAGCDVALWRTRAEHTPLVGEFAYQVKFDRRSSVHDKAKKLGEQFFITLQREVQGWLALGTTKTGMLYRSTGDGAPGVVSSAHL